MAFIKGQQENKLLPIIIGGSFENDPIEGITKGKQYSVIYEGKDEVEVINDFGEKECYSKNCFEVIIKRELLK